LHLSVSKFLQHNPKGIFKDDSYATQYYKFGPHSRMKPLAQSYFDLIFHARQVS